MAESPEHKFVSSTFVRVVDQLSRSELFGYREADRGRFDFACVLQRDHSRQLVGQTLTRHAEGIEKDLNSLLFGDSSELPIYLYAQSTRNEARIREVLHEARLALPDRVALVRLYPYPPDFDADKESDRATVEECIRDRMVDDLLLNVLFGRLSATDVALFLNSTGIPGVSLAALEAIGLFGFFNFPELANNLGGSINPSTLRPRVQALVTAGMLETALRASLYRISQRGRVFLQLCNLISRQQVINAELAIILERLALDASREPIQAFEGLRETLGVDAPLHRRRWLGFEVVAARKDFGVPISGGPYPLDSTPQHRGAPDVWIGR